MTKNRTKNNFSIDYWTLTEQYIQKLVLQPITSQGRNLKKVQHISLPNSDSYLIT